MKLRPYKITLVIDVDYTIAAPSKEAAEEFGWHRVHDKVDNGIDAYDFHVDVSESDDPISDVYFGDTSKLAEKHKGDPNIDGLNFEDFSNLDDEIAELIGNHNGDINLSSVTELSDSEAESLSKHEGVLYL